MCVTDIFIIFKIPLLSDFTANNINCSRLMDFHFIRKLHLFRLWQCFSFYNVNLNTKSRIQSFSKLKQTDKLPKAINFHHNVEPKAAYLVLKRLTIIYEIKCHMVLRCNISRSNYFKGFFFVISLNNSAPKLL